MSEPNAEKVVSTLKTTMRIAGVTNREVERTLNLSGGYLTRLLSGAIDVRLSHIFNILDIIGLNPAEFFFLVCGPLPEPPTETMQKIRSLVPQVAPPAPPVVQEVAPRVDPEELKRQLADAIAKVIGDALRTTRR